ncbi:hypothetical protein, partial [Streptomyces sparsus]
GREPSGDTLDRSDDGPSGHDDTGAGQDGDGRDGDRQDGDEQDGDEQDGDDRDGDGPRRSLTVYAAGTGPRDWKLAPPSAEDDHFVPPDPPPPPRGDTVTRFAWFAVLGGPALLFGTVLFQLDMTWWITTLGIGGFLGGFGTLVARMRDGRDDDGFDDPGRGAVV